MAKCWCNSRKLIDFSKDYYKCENCGTLISKKIDEISRILNSNSKDSNYIYNADYWKKKMVKESGLGSFNNLLNSYFTGRVPYWLSTISKYKEPPAKVFEIGCGLGQLSYTLKQFGYDVTASEMDKNIVGFIKKEFGIKTKLGEYNEHIKYDLIIANDVIEHIDAPNDFISKIKRTLKKDGYFVAQTPCYDGVSTYEELKENNERFLSLLIADEHLYIFSRKSFTKLLKKFDLKCVFEDAYFGNNYDMYAIIGNEKPVKNTNNHNYLVNAFSSLEKEKRYYEKINYDTNIRLAQFDSDIRYLNTVVKDKNLIIKEKDQLTNKISSLESDIHSFEEKVKKLDNELMVTIDEKKSFDNKINELNDELSLSIDNADKKIDMNKLDNEDLIKLRNIYSFISKNGTKDCNVIDNKTLNDLISFIENRIK